MIDEIDPSKFTREIFGCDPEDIGETVVLTPGKKSVQALNEKVEVLKEFKGFLKGFTGNYGGKSISAICLLLNEGKSPNKIKDYGSNHFHLQNLSEFHHHAIICKFDVEFL